MPSIGDLNDLPELEAQLKAEEAAQAKIFMYPYEYHTNIQARMGAYLAFLNSSHEDDALKTLYNTLEFIRNDPDEEIKIPDEMYWGFVRYYNARVAYRRDTPSPPVKGRREYVGNVVSLYQLQRVLRTKDADEEAGETVPEIIIRGFVDQESDTWVESLSPAFWAKMRSDTLWELKKYQLAVEHKILEALDNHFIGVDEDEDAEWEAEQKRKEEEREKRSQKIQADIQKMIDDGQAAMEQEENGESEDNSEEEE